MLLRYSVDWRHESGCDRLDALTLAKKLAVLIPPEFLCSGQVDMGGLPDAFHTALGEHLAV